jgi:hypothetical protein
MWAESLGAGRWGQTDGRTDDLLWKQLAVLSAVTRLGPSHFNSRHLHFTPTPIKIPLTPSWLMINSARHQNPSLTPHTSHLTLFYSLCSTKSLSSSLPCWCPSKNKSVRETPRQWESGVRFPSGTTYFCVSVLFPPSLGPTDPPAKCSSISVYVRFDVFTVMSMKNVVFWDIKPQFVLHRRHITSPLQSSAS